MIVFACPGCSQKLKVGDERAGKKIKCPKCAGITPVPRQEAPPVAVTEAPRKATPRTISLPAKKQTTVASAPPPPKAAPAKGNGRPILSVVLVLLVLGGGVALTAYTILNTDSTEEPNATGTSEPVKQKDDSAKKDKDDPKVKKEDPLVKDKDDPKVKKDDPLAKDKDDPKVKKDDPLAKDKDDPKVKKEDPLVKGKDDPKVKGKDDPVVKGKDDPKVKGKDVDDVAELLKRKPVLVASTGQDMISSMACSPNGKWLATGGWDRTVRLWDVASGREIRTFAGYKSKVDCLAISPDNKWLFSSNYWIAKLSELATGKQVHLLKGHTSKIGTAAFSRDGKWLVTGSGDPTQPGDFSARLWEVETGKQVRVFEEHDNAVTFVGFTRNGKQVVTASADGKVRLWKLDSDKAVREFGEENILAAALSADNKWIVTANTDNMARLWDFAEGKLVRTFEHADPILGVAFSPDGKRIATADGKVRQWDVESGKEIKLVKTFKTGYVSTVCFTDDGKWLMNGGMFGVYRHDAATGKEVRNYQQEALLNNVICFSSDGKTMVTGIHLQHWTWDLATGKRVSRSEGNIKELGRRDVLSPDGKWLWAGTQMFDTATGKEKRQAAGVQCAAYSRDGKWLVTGSEDRTATLWKLPEFEEVRVLEGDLPRLKGPKLDRDGNKTIDLASVGSVSLSADGSLAALGRTWGGTVDIFDLKSGKKRHTLAFDKKRIRAALLSNDGKTLLADTTDMSRDENRAIELWNVADGQMLRSFKPKPADKGVNRTIMSNDPIAISSVSPDFKRLVACGNFNEVYLWEIDTGKEVRVFKGHPNNALCAAMTPDGKRILSSGSDGMRIWDAATGKELCRACYFGEGVWGVFDAEGRFDADNPDDIEGLHWVVGDQAFPLGKFKKQFHDPGLLGKYLGVNPAELRSVPE